MEKEIIKLERVDTLMNVKRALISGHHAFPIMNNAGNMIGMLPYNFLITILEEKGYYVSEEEET